MTVHVRTLLVPVALCWVAPLPAQQPAPVSAASYDSECPYERAEAEAKAAEVRSQPVVIKADSRLLQHRGPAAALLP